MTVIVTNELCALPTVRAVTLRCIRKDGARPLVSREIRGTLLNEPRVGTGLVIFRSTTKAFVTSPIQRVLGEHSLVFYVETTNSVYELVEDHPRLRGARARRCCGASSRSARTKTVRTPRHGRDRVFTWPDRQASVGMACAAPTRAAASAREHERNP